MAEKYRKVDPRIWRDEKFTALNERDKIIVLYTITAQCNRIGLFSFSPALAAEDIGINFDTFRKRFANVCFEFNWAFNDTFRVLYIPTWWKYNFPENPNVLKGNLKDLHDVPTSPLTTLFYKNITYLGKLAETFTDTLAKRYPKPYPKQEQEQEQEQECILHRGKTPDEGRKNGGEFYISKKKKKLSGKKLEDFIRFWEAFSYKDGKAEAADAFIGVYSPSLMENIVKGAEAEVSARQAVLAKNGTPKMAEGWLSGRRWEKYTEESNAGSQPKSHDYSALKVGVEVSFRGETYEIEEGFNIYPGGDGSSIAEGGIKKLYREGQLTLV